MEAMIAQVFLIQTKHCIGSSLSKIECSHNKSMIGVSYDYLNSIHVDYRGLIEKGLALEAPEDMYN
jgi:hypothetical protein